MLGVNDTASRLAWVWSPSVEGRTWPGAGNGQAGAASNPSVRVTGGQGCRVSSDHGQGTERTPIRCGARRRSIGYDPRRGVVGRTAPRRGASTDARGMARVARRASPARLGRLAGQLQQGDAPRALRLRRGGRGGAVLRLGRQQGEQARRARSMLWFAPRKPRTGWSRPNKLRIEKMTAAGQMAEAGLAKVRAAQADGSWVSLDAVEALEVPPDLAAAFGRHPGSAQRFEAFPRSAKRRILEWIASRSGQRPGRRGWRRRRGCGPRGAGESVEAASGCGWWSSRIQEGRR